MTHSFRTIWRISATPHEILSVLSDETLFPEWWPSAFLWVRRRDEGAVNGLGRTADLATRGFLPYILRWRIVVVDISSEKDGFTVQAQGDLNGTGKWTVRPHGDGSEVSFLWSVQVGHRQLRRFEWLLWPLFRANHRWCMRLGERSLSLEVRRRRGNAGDLGQPPVPLTMNVLWRRLTKPGTPRS